MPDTLRTWTAVMSTVAAGAAIWAASQRPPALRSASASVPSVSAPVAQPPAPTGGGQPTPPSPLMDSDAFPKLPRLGQSEGFPANGHLHKPSRLPAADDRVIRNPDTAFATADTVQHLDAAIAAVKRAHPRVHRLLVGDLSFETGGKLVGHVSHQSGRDVDLGFYYKERVGPGLRVFEDGTRENLNIRATFSLMRALAESHGKPGGMQWGLLDYQVQRTLVQYARRSGAVSSDDLDVLFQYPKGAYAPVGLFRHYPNHRNHVHVRFACPKGDPFCESPPGPPVRTGKAADVDVDVDVEGASEQLERKRRRRARRRARQEPLP